MTLPGLAARLIHLSTGMACGATVKPTPGPLAFPPRAGSGCIELGGPLDDQALAWLCVASIVGFVTCTSRDPSARGKSCRRAGQHQRDRTCAAYALASLGCTLPAFLSVVATSFQLHGALAAAGQFMLFGLGMGIVLTAVTTATAFLDHGLIRRLRALAPHVRWMTAVLMWLAGAYVLYYWLTAERLM